MFQSPPSFPGQFGRQFLQLGTISRLLGAFGRPKGPSTFLEAPPYWRQDQVRMLGPLERPQKSLPKDFLIEKEATPRPDPFEVLSLPKHPMSSLFFTVFLYSLFFFFLVKASTTQCFGKFAILDQVLEDMQTCLSIIGPMPDKIHAHSLYNSDIQVHQIALLTAIRTLYSFLFDHATSKPPSQIAANSPSLARTIKQPTLYPTFLLNLFVGPSIHSISPKIPPVGFP